MNGPTHHPGLIKIVEPEDFARKQEDAAFVEKWAAYADGELSKKIVETAWHKARNAWFDHSYHFTQAEADAVAIDILMTAFCRFSGQISDQTAKPELGE